MNLFKDRKWSCSDQMQINVKKDKISFIIILNVKINFFLNLAIRRVFFFDILLQKFTLRFRIIE